MAGPQDYLTVKGPEGASYQLPKFDLGSQIAQIPTSYQEGQQYGVKRALQTAFQNGFPQDENGNPQYLEMAKRMLQIAGPEAAQPYFDMAIQQGNVAGNTEFYKRTGGGGALPDDSPQTRPPPKAETSASGPEAIRGSRTGPVGSILPNGAQLTGEGGTVEDTGGQPQAGAGVDGQPAPFFANRIPAGGWGPGVGGSAPGAPVSVASAAPISFNARVPAYGGMSNRPTDQEGAPPGPIGGAPTVAEDGTSGQPTAPTSSREVAQNAPAPDPATQRLLNAADKADAAAAEALQRAGYYKQSPGAVKSLQDYADLMKSKSKQYRDAALERQKLTEQEKNLASGTTRDLDVQKGITDASKQYYAGLRGQELQYQNNNGPAIQTAKSILQNPKMYAGFGANTVLDFNRLRSLYGDKEPAALQEALKKVTAINLLSQFNDQRAQLEEQGQQSGRMFATQVQPLMDASASIESTIKGNLFLANYQDRIGKYQSELAGMARVYRATHHGILDDGFDNQVAAHMKAKPIFTPQEQANPLLLASPDAPPTVKDKATAHAWAMTMGLKTGDSIRLPNGSYASVP